MDVPTATIQQGEYDGYAVYTCDKLHIFKTLAEVFQFLEVLFAK